MNFGQTVAGQQNKWSLVEKLGEGDAGEVYLVESLLKGKLAILKRPRESNFSSDVLRQAAQIKMEGNILRALGGISLPHQGTSISTPTLLDQSPPESGVADRYFIVIDRAPGFDLKSLARLSHFGQVERENALSGEEQKFFLQKLSELDKVPESILIRTLFGVLNLLEAIHSAEIWNDGARQFGVIWNDIKAEHLYWDPIRPGLTVIDWGNGAFLEADGTTKDRRHSRVDDYYQFVQAMGAFLSESHPDLCARLEWPQDISPGNAYSDGVKPLKERLAALNEQVLTDLRDLRNVSLDLYGTSRPGLDLMPRCDEFQRRIVSFGEIPNFSSAINFHARVALQTVSEKDLQAFQQVCERTSKLATSATQKWVLLEEISRITSPTGDVPEERFRESVANILAAGIADDWRTLLWDLFELVGGNPLPDWWDDLAQGVRRIHLKLDPDALTPFITVSRVFHTLQAMILQMGDKNRGSGSGGDGEFTDQLRASENLLKIFHEEVVKKWREVEPSPPNSGIGYAEIDDFIGEIEAILPETREKLESVLTQPKAQAQIVLNAWERKDFETARQALRNVLLWDPDRRRLIQANRAIGAASRWLTKVRNGAAADEPFYDYLTSVELEGRNLRNRVGGAKWLDLILEALKGLRKGARPADLIMEHPELLEEIPWLNEHRSREILSLTRTHSLALERDRSQPGIAKTVTGVVEGRLGADQDMFLAEPLDTWVPEARGSSARVFAGNLRNRNGKSQSLAVKIIRPDRMEYALPLFREEAQILSMLQDVPGVSPLVECGFLRIEEGLKFPSEERHASADHLLGTTVRFGVEEVQNYLASMDRHLAQGWLPYLALVRRNQEQNLMKYCDAGYTHGWFLPLRESLLLAIQICEILQSAHDRNIVYRDHKLLHYYWDPETHGVVMIDWNIAKRHAQGLSDAERQFDLIQFGARALHHILTGRPAQGALPLGPNRPEEIEQASLSYPVNWTYDDERLPNRVKEILEQVLHQGYSQIRNLRTDLIEVYQQIPDPVQDGSIFTS